MKKAMLARFDGSCTICEQDIVADQDQIVNMDNEWVHVDCAREEGEEVEGA